MIVRRKQAVNSAGFKGIGNAVRCVEKRIARIGSSVFRSGKGGFKVRNEIITAFNFLCAISENVVKIVFAAVGRVSRLKNRLMKNHVTRRADGDRFFNNGNGRFGLFGNRCNIRAVNRDNISF